MSKIIGALWDHEELFELLEKEVCCNFSVEYRAPTHLDAVYTDRQNIIVNFDSVRPGTKPYSRTVHFYRHDPLVTLWDNKNHCPKGCGGWGYLLQVHAP